MTRVRCHSMNVPLVPVSLLHLKTLVGTRIRHVGCRPFAAVLHVKGGGNAANRPVAKVLPCTLTHAHQNENDTAIAIRECIFHLLSQRTSLLMCIICVYRVERPDYSMISAKTLRVSVRVRYTGWIQAYTTTCVLLANKFATHRASSEIGVKPLKICRGRRFLSIFKT